MLHAGVLFAQIMGVVRSHKRDARLLRKLHQHGQHPALLRQAVVLYFNIIVSLAKQLLIILRGGFRLFIVARQQRLRKLARQTGGKADKPFVVFFQQGVVDARLVVKAIDKACRHQLNKVFIACLIFTQEHQVVRAIDAVHLIETRTRGHVYFAADNGLDARLFRGFIKIDAAVHHAVVGDSHSRLAQLFHPFHQRLDAACAVQKAVFSVQMQMCKLPAVFNCHGLPPPVRLPALPAFLCGAKGRIC